MQLLDLTVSNAFSFGKDCTLNFSELSNHTQILGKNLDEDPENSSNGSGKTNTYLVLQQVLYGKDLKSTLKADITNTYGDSSGYSIRLRFLKNNNIYTVISVRSGTKTQLTVFENGKDISCHTVPETQKLIVDIVGLDYKLFTALTYQSTSTYLDLLTTTDSERKRILVNLFNLDEYTNQIEVFKKLLNESSTSISTLTKNLQFAESYTSTVIEPNKVYVKFNNDNRLEELADEITEIKIGLANITSTNREYTKHSILAKEIKELQDALDSLECPIINIEDRKALQNKVIAKKTELAELRKQLKIYSDKPKSCPTCGQLVQTQFSQEKVDALTIEVQAAIGDINDLTDKINILLDQEQLVDKFNTLQRAIHSKVSLYDPEKNKEQISTADLQDKLDELKCEQRQLLDEKKGLEQANLEISKFNSRQELLAKQKAEAESKIKKIKAELEQETKKRKAFTVLQEASKKLVTFKLESLLIYLQDAINRFIELLFSEDVALLISLKNEKLHFKVTKSGKEYTINRLSTGEATRLQIAVLLAIREVLTQVNNADIDIIFLDEILSSLDAVGRDSIYSILNNLPFKVLSISHSYYDNKLPYLTVVKEDGISRIE